MKIQILTLFLLITTFGGVFAQLSNNTIKDTIDIDEVIITGTKTAVNRNQVPLTLSIVTSSTIEQSAESAILPVLSEQVPGLFVTERGITGFGVADGAAGQVSIRGLGGSPTTQVLFLVNGNPQYMGIMGHPLADAYRSSNIERVEIIRGPASTLYGSNAMGGVVNIITKEQNSDGVSAHANFSYGSFNTLKLAAGAGYKNKGFSVVGGINHDQSDGHRDASYFDITDGYVRTAYDFNSHFNASIDLSVAQFNGADPGLDTAEVIEPGDTLDILRGMGAFVFNNKFDKADGSLRIFYNFGDHEITSGFISNDYNYGLVWYENFKLFTGNTITLGVDYKTYGGKADLTKFPGGWALTDTSMTEIAGYASVQQNLFSKLTLNAGVRFDNHSIFGPEIIPTGGFAYHPFENTTFKGSVSKGFRSPTIRELFIQFPGGASAPNPDLKPEEAINMELSVQQSLFSKKLDIELAVFSIDANNLIKVGMTDGNLTFSNTGETKNTGVEFALNHKVSKLFAWTTNYTYINMETDISGTPKHKFYLAGTLTPGKFSLNVSIQYIDGLITANSTESFIMVNSRLAYQIFESLGAFIKADNLLNQDYQINYGYTMPGTTVMAGVNFHLNK